MYTSTSLTHLGPSLLKAQVLMGGALKGSKNPYFKSTYADLGAVLAACKDLLNENGVLILQPVNRDALGTFVETTLLHAESGEFISSVTPVVFSKEGDPQAQGSAITYARRYGLQSLLGMPAEDDDGEKAMLRKPKEYKASPETENPGTVTLQNPEKVVSGTVKVNNLTPIEGTLVTADLPVEKPRTTFRKPKVEEVSNGKTDDLGLS